MRKTLLIAFSLMIALSITGTALAQGANDSEMEYGDTHYGSISDSNWYNWHCFAGTSGDEIVVSMEATSGNLDGLLTLNYLSSDGEWYSLGEVDDYNGSRDPYFVETLPHTTTYCIRATRYGFNNGSSTGTYSIRLELLDLHEITDEEAEASEEYQERQNDSTPISYGDTQYGFISDQDHAGYHCFDGSAGDEITATMTAASGDLDGYLILQYRNSSYEWQSLEAVDDSNDTLNPQLSTTLPHTGHYCLNTTRFGESEGSSSGAYILQLTGPGYSGGQGYESHGSNTGCPEDADCDGLTDAREEWIIDSFTPYYQYDEGEHDLINDQNRSDFNEFAGVAYMYQVSPVNCAYVDSEIIYDSFAYEEPNPPSILLTVVAIYGYDYAPMDPVGPGGEVDAWNHYGDTEAARVCLQRTEETETSATYDTAFIHVVRHHHDHVYQHDDLQFLDRTHPLLIISEGKHAAFATKNECEAAVSWTDVWKVWDPSNLQWFGWDEDCSSYNEDNGSLLIIPSHRPNVGEYDPDRTARLSDFDIYNPFNMTTPASYIGGHAVYDAWDPYLDEYVWHTINGPQPFNPRYDKFCGTYNVEDYYEEHSVYGVDFPVCSGSLVSKWWQPSIDEEYSTSR